MAAYGVVKRFTPALRAAGLHLAQQLGQARSYRVYAGRLTLFDAGGNESLIFEAAGIRR